MTLLTRVPTYHECPARQIRPWDWVRLHSGEPPLEVISVQVRGCVVRMQLETWDGRLLPYWVSVDAVLDRMGLP